MLKTLRRIRRKLLSEGSFKKYLLYAGGEIFLIVIGILLALQLNNWNISRQHAEEEKKLLEELMQSIAEDSMQLEELITDHKRTRRSIAIIVDEFQSKRVFHDSIGLHLGMMVGFTTFRPNVGAYESLKSRGINIISNDSIRLGISNLFERSYEDVQFDQTWYIENFHSYLKPKILEHFADYNLFNTSIPVDFQTLKEDKELLRNLNLMLDMHDFSLGILTFTLEDVKSILRQIEHELKK